MASNQFPFRYTTGRASNVVGLIKSLDRSTIRISGTTMTAVSAVADASYATGRLSATERTTSSATATGEYILAAFPLLAAAFYTLEIYDVTTPSNSSPGPTTLPIADASFTVYWNGTAFSEGVTSIDTLGSGADRCTITITETGSGDPIADADVWISTDSAGANTFAGTRQTNSLGKVLFMLDAGLTYYLWMQKDGQESIDGQSFTAVAD